MREAKIPVPSSPRADIKREIKAPIDPEGFHSILKKKLLWLEGFSYAIDNPALYSWRSDVAALLNKLREGKEWGETWESIKKFGKEVTDLTDEDEDNWAKHALYSVNERCCCVSCSKYWHYTNVIDALEQWEKKKLKESQ